jgi:hypothetical protein
LRNPFTEATNHVLLVEDAHKDIQFSSNSLVISSPFIRFYAGASIYFQSEKVGTFWLIDTELREDLIQDKERVKNILKDFAMTVSEILEDRYHREQLYFLNGVIMHQCTLRLLQPALQFIQDDPFLSIQADLSILSTMIQEKPKYEEYLHLLSELYIKLQYYQQQVQWFAEYSEIVLYTIQKKEMCFGNLHYHVKYLDYLQLTRNLFQQLQIPQLHFQITERLEKNYHLFQHYHHFDVLYLCQSIFLFHRQESQYMMILDYHEETKELMLQVMKTDEIQIQSKDYPSVFSVSSSSVSASTPTYFQLTSKTTAKNIKPISELLIPSSNFTPRDIFMPAIKSKHIFDHLNQNANISNTNHPFSGQHSNLSSLSTIITPRIFTLPAIQNKQDTNVNKLPSTSNNNNNNNNKSNKNSNNNNNNDDILDIFHHLLPMIKGSYTYEIIDESYIPTPYDQPLCDCDYHRSLYQTTNTKTASQSHIHAESVLSHFQEISYPREEETQRFTHTTSCWTILLPISPSCPSSITPQKPFSYSEPQPQSIFVFDKDLPSPPKSFSHLELEELSITIVDKDLPTPQKTFSHLELEELSITIVDKDLPTPQKTFSHSEVEPEAEPGTQSIFVFDKDLPSPQKSFSRLKLEPQSISVFNMFDPNLNLLFDNSITAYTMNIFSDDVVEQTKKDFVWHEDICA